MKKNIGKILILILLILYLISTLVYADTTITKGLDGVYGGQSIQFSTNAPGGHGLTFNTIGWNIVMTGGGQTLPLYAPIKPPNFTTAIKYYIPISDGYVTTYDSSWTRIANSLETIANGDSRFNTIVTSPTFKVTFNATIQMFNKDVAIPGKTASSSYAALHLADYVGGWSSQGTIDAFTPAPVGTYYGFSIMFNKELSHTGSVTAKYINMADWSSIISNIKTPYPLIGGVSNPVVSPKDFLASKNLKFIYSTVNNDGSTMYDVNHQPTPVNLNTSKPDQTVEFYYSPAAIPGTITINYKDNRNMTIIDPATGKLKLPIPINIPDVANPPTIDDAYLVTYKDAIVGYDSPVVSPKPYPQLSKNQTSVTIDMIYTKSITSGDLTVHYIDSSTKLQIDTDSYKVFTVPHQITSSDVLIKTIGTYGAGRITTNPLPNLTTSLLNGIVNVEYDKLPNTGALKVRYVDRADSTSIIENDINTNFTVTGASPYMVKSSDITIKTIDGYSNPSYDTPLPTLTTSALSATVLVKYDKISPTPAPVVIPQAPPAPTGPVAGYTGINPAIEGNTINLQSTSYTTAIGATLTNYNWSLPSASGSIGNSPTGSIVYPSEGSYPESLTVTDSNGLSDTYNFTRTILQALPVAGINVGGTLKQYRTTIISASDYSPSSGYPILTAQNEWSIVPDLATQMAGTLLSDIKYSNTSTDVIKNVFFLKPGTYLVAHRCRNAKYISSWINQTITIAPDLPPIISLSSASKVYIDSTTGQALIDIYVTASSIDDDIISQIILEQRYNSKNDGDFSTETPTITYYGNVAKITLSTSQLGKFQFKATAVEMPGQPYPLDLWSTLYQQSTVSSPIVVERDNIPPYVSWDAMKKSKVQVDILSDYTGTKLATLQTSINTFKAQLASNGVDATVNISTSTVNNYMSIGPYKDYISELGTTYVVKLDGTVWNLNAGTQVSGLSNIVKIFGGSQASGFSNEWFIAQTSTGQQYYWGTTYNGYYAVSHPANTVMTFVGGYMYEYNIVTPILLSTTDKLSYMMDGMWGFSTTGKLMQVTISIDSLTYSIQSVGELWGGTTKTFQDVLAVGSFQNNVAPAATDVFLGIDSSGFLNYTGRSNSFVYGTTTISLKSLAQGGSGCYGYGVSTSGSLVRLYFNGSSMSSTALGSIPNYTNLKKLYIMSTFSYALYTDGSLYRYTGSIEPYNGIWVKVNGVSNITSMYNDTWQTDMTAISSTDNKVYLLYNVYSSLDINSISLNKSSGVNKYFVYVGDGTSNNYASGFGNFYGMGGLTKNFINTLVTNNYSIYSVTPSVNLDYILPESSTQNATIRQMVNTSALNSGIYDTGQYQSAFDDIFTKIVLNKLAESGVQIKNVGLTVVTDYAAGSKLSDLHTRVRSLKYIATAKGVQLNTNIIDGNNPDILVDGTQNIAYLNDWLSAPTSSIATTVNSVANSILNVTSTTIDPEIPMYSLGSFSPLIYKYVEVKYRINSGGSTQTQIYFNNSTYTSATEGAAVWTPAMIADGQYHIMDINMTTSPAWATGGNITGWRYDWATTAGVNMDLDYIKLVDKPYTPTIAQVGLSKFSVASASTNADNYFLYVGDGTGNTYTNGFGNYYGLGGLTNVFNTSLASNNYSIFAVTPTANLDYTLPESTTQNATIRQMVNASTQDNGLYDIGHTQDALDEILNNISLRLPSDALTRYVLLNDTVNYSVNYGDYESNPQNALRWKYYHDPSSFDNNQGTISDSGQWTTEKDSFDHVGPYLVDLNAQDDPTSNDNRFANYRYWSQSPATLNKIVVHRAPIAAFTVLLTPNVGKTLYTTQVVNASYDLDHISYADKGIKSLSWKWKNITDSTWTAGSLPGSLPSNNDYLLSIAVTDYEGVTTVLTKPVSTQNTLSIPTIDASPISRAWANTDANTTITASDSTNGITSIFYQWSTSSTMPVSGYTEVDFASPILNQTLNVSQPNDGIWHLYMVAVNVVGMTNFKMEGTYNVDKTPPSSLPLSVSATYINGNDLWIANGQSATFTTSWTDPLSGNSTFSALLKNGGINYLRVDHDTTLGNNTKTITSYQGGELTCTNVNQTANNQPGETDVVFSFTSQTNTEGDYPVTINSKDKAGNDYSLVNGQWVDTTFKIRVDNTAPTITADITNGSLQPGATITLTSGDLRSGVKETWDMWSSSSNPVGTLTGFAKMATNRAVAPSVDGTYYHHVKCYDNVGNMTYTIFGSYTVSSITVAASLSPNPAKQGQKITFKVDTTGFAKFITIYFPNEIWTLDTSTPIITQIPEQASRTDTITYYLPMSTPKTIDDSGNRIVPAYIIQVKGEKADGTFKVVNLLLDVKGSILDGIKTEIKKN